MSLPSTLAKRRRCKTLTQEQTQELTTAQLMKRRQTMLSLESDRHDSDCYQSELELISQHEDQWLFFKDDSRWETQYQDLRNILSTRENYPSKQERKLKRQQQAESKSSS